MKLDSVPLSPLSPLSFFFFPFFLPFFFFFSSFTVQSVFGVHSGPSHVPTLRQTKAGAVELERGGLHWSHIERWIWQGLKTDGSEGREQPKLVPAFWPGGPGELVMAFSPAGTSGWSREEGRSSRGSLARNGDRREARQRSPVER